MPKYVPPKMMLTSKTNHIKAFLNLILKWYGYGHKDQCQRNQCSNPQGKKGGFEECVKIISLQYNKVWILYHVEMISNRSHLNRQYLCLLHSRLKQIIRGFRTTAYDCSAACTNLMMKLHEQILFFSYCK